MVDLVTDIDDSAPLTEEQEAAATTDAELPPEKCSPKSSSAGPEEMCEKPPKAENSKGG